MKAMYLWEITNILKKIRKNCNETIFYSSLLYENQLLCLIKYLRKMKTVLTLLFMGIYISAFSQNKDVKEIIEKFEGKTGITVISLNKDLLNMVSTSKQDSSDLGNVLKGITEIRILVIEKKNPEQKELFKTMVQKMPVKQYKELMVVKDGKDQIKMFAIENKGKITDFILTVIGENDNVLINISGNIDMRRLSGLYKDMNFSGFNHLAKLENKQK